MTNKQLADAAKDLAARADGLRRRAWLCIAVACGTTSSLSGASTALDSIELGDVRAAAQQLLAELAAASTTTETP